MEYKSTIFNSIEKGSKLFFPSLFNVIQLNVKQMAKMSDRAPNERLLLYVHVHLHVRVPSQVLIPF